MPNPHLPLLFPPAHTICYAGGTAPHRGPAQLFKYKAWATGGDGTAAAYRSTQEYKRETVTLHTILLGVSGTDYAENTLYQFNN
eukprot:1153552-Pelagomonas_calceolata.AAC.1